jgi:two-component system NtrC family sensor kinase
MRRRDKVGGKAAKAQRRKALGRRDASKAVRRRDRSSAEQEAEVAQLRRELQEALQQQTATADVLKVISRSAFNLQTVLDTLTESAVRLCEADSGILRTREGDFYPVAATHRLTEQQRDRFTRYSTDPDRGSLFGRAILEGRTIHVPDVLADPEYDRSRVQDLVTVRAGLAVPMMREGTVVGVITLQRREPRPFSDKQIQLVTTFADQAVIAIENVRLFEEVQARTHEVSEALEQQTATSEVLQVISRSPGELEPVFKAMLQNATGICGANFGVLWLCKDDEFQVASIHNIPAAYREHLQPGIVFHPGPELPVARATRTHQTVHIADLRRDPAYIGGEPVATGGVELGGVRTLLAVPMLKDQEVVGAFVIYRQEVRPFTDKQIDLVKNFAAQAVIAIENARLLNELRKRTDDLSESLEQQTATSEVLRVISSSPTNVQPVFDAIAESAVRLCDGQFSFVLRFDGKVMDFASCCGLSAEGLDAFRSILPMPASEDTASGRAIVRRAIVEIPDVEADPSYGAQGRGLAKAVTYRSIAAVPLLHEGNPIGSIAVARANAGSFPKRQIALLQAFADQAVIAIENVRLFDEVQARTRDLAESLQQQTATADVLKVISSSPGDLEPVFETMLANAVRICGAKFGNLFLCEGDRLRAVAFHGAPPAYVEERWRNPMLHPTPATVLGRAMATRHPVQVADIQSYEPDNVDAAPGTTGVKLAQLAGARTVLAVPMVKERELVGAVVIYRQEVLPFNDKQVELVQNFGAQAVIAIENTRLLNELRESLQQQTATADVLKVISSSPGDLVPVFQAMLEKATQLCEAKFGIMFRFADGVFRATSWQGNPPAYTIEQPHIVSENPHNLLTRIVSTKRPVYSSDLMKERAYIEGNPRYVALVETVGARSLLVVPMLKNEELIGAIAIYWQEARSFTEKQMELISNFAAQAVIAIDNARLLSELRESLQQQTATADVLKVISRSTFDLQTVLDTLTKSAARLCEADRGVIFQRDNDVYNLSANYGFSSEAEQYALKHPFQLDRGSVIGRVSLEARTIHIPDVLSDPEYRLADYQKTFGYRTILGVPLLREGEVIGVISVTRDLVNPFTEKQIELVTTFADQAVIAIENARLFEEVQARTRELAASLDNLRNTQDRLVQTQKLASLGQLTAGIAHEIKNPLNFVNNFSGVSAELIDELQGALKGLPIDKKARTEINELTDTLRRNLEKVVQHGKRADAIVKNMLLHSREGSGEHRPVDINAIVEESLNLAYHGARAEKQSFNITLERSFDPTAGEADVFPQDITRVLLNLISNGFYATKRKGQAGSDGYEPTLAASTRSLGNQVEIKIRDNGTGIPPEVMEKIFNPFFTTKPAGEGTGLGLSISHDIIVKQHGGSIEVDTETGEYTEFRIVLPRTSATLANPGD